MPRKTAAEKEEARLLRLHKKEEREKRKETKKGKKDKENPKSQSKTNQSNVESSQNKKDRGRSFLVELPGDALSLLFCFLPSRELGALCCSCQSINLHLKDGRIQHLLSRLNQTINFNHLL